MYENVTVVKTRASLHDPDLLAFHKMVKSVRGLYICLVLKIVIDTETCP